MASLVDDLQHVNVERVFIGAGCNRAVNNVSWGACDLVSFGSQNAVSIFCPKTAQIRTTLPGHKASVNCTQWLPNSKFAFKAKGLEQHFLLSGDSDGFMILWEYCLTNKKWRHVLQLPHLHKKGVTCISGIMVSHKEAVFASTSSDGMTNVWDLVFPSNAGGDCKVSCLDSISIGSRPMVTLSLSELPGNSGQLVLAMGGLDSKIRICSGCRTGKFVLVCELKGHNDWIRSLDFSLPIVGNGEASILLVSSSQDKGIRIWKIASSQSSGDSKDQEFSLSSYMKGPVFVAGPSSYQVSMESLLIGHEDWVYSVVWQPPSFMNGNECYQPQRLLSASMDKTMMIWQPEKITGIWMNVVTVGEFGHCALGFYGGQWSPMGDAILAYGYGGSFHLWKNVGAVSDDWKPQKVPSGHFASVSDIAWARCGEYILSVSYDQTTRIFSPWSNRSSSAYEEAWHEIARPQVHGHDINCVTIIQGKGNHRFISGADEKVSRVFEAPVSFLKTLNHATHLESNFSDDVEVGVQILGANMSALGLSQKPIYSQGDLHKSTKLSKNDGLDTLETVPEAVPVELTEPPIEEQLARNTLWPESHKLYGHGNELYSLCCNREGTLVASSCKAQSASVAEIWLWQVGSWKSVGRLHSHSLTVTKMEFSYDDKHLLTVSRDRHFSIFSIKHTDEISYELVTKQEAHKRIIWACSWNPFGHEFATGSRDKTVKVWSLNDGSSVRLLMTLPPFNSSVTALSWVGLKQQSNLGCLAVGMESGMIELWSLCSGRSIDGGAALVPTARCLIQFDPFLCHVSPVHRLSWRNWKKSEDCKNMQLASCGADHTVRVFDVVLV